MNKLEYTKHRTINSQNLIFIPWPFNDFFNDSEANDPKA